MEMKILDILIIDHSEEDVAHIQRVLEEGGLQLNPQRVDRIDALHDALCHRHWDIILSDYSLPELSVQDVLAAMSSHQLDIPFIVVSSKVGEEAAVPLMAKGVHDFIMKANLSRLVPAIQRSMREVENFQCLDRIQVALQKSEARFRASTSNLPGVVFQFLQTKEGNVCFPYVSEASETLLGLPPQAVMDEPALFEALILTDDKESYHQLMAISASQLSTWNWEGCIQARGANDVKWISLRATPRKTQKGATLWDGIMINITRNKLAEKEIARSREQLAELSSYSQKVKEHERARIAREIHDDIGGILTAIKCELLPCIDGEPQDHTFYQKKTLSIELLVDRVIDSTRRISLDLRPGILDCGILAAVQWQAKEFDQRTGIVCQVDCDQEEIPLDADLAVAIFRVFQETLTNIAKHAQATRIQVKLAEEDDWIDLEVTDNGCGITVTDMEKHDSFGIRGMHERCQQLSGNFYVSGQQGVGTTVSIRIPVKGMEMPYKMNLDHSFVKPGQSDFLQHPTKRKIFQ